MSIEDSREKINPVVNFGDAQSAGPKPIAKIYYGVKGYCENTKTRLPQGENAARYYTAAIIILVGLSSFGLGRLSAIDEGRQPIMIENVNESAPQQTASVASSVTGQMSNVNGSAKGAEPLAAGGKLMGSRNGTKYYFPWCGSNIAEKNKIWFNSEAEAKQKGYSPAANCKGLK